MPLTQLELGEATQTEFVICNHTIDEQNRLVWAGNSGSQPLPGNGTCGTGTLASMLQNAGYGTSYVYTHLGQLWQGPQGNTSTPSQYLYCDSSHPHQLTGLYSLGATCSNKTGQTYGSLYDAWGNVTSRTVGSTTATLSYDGLDHLTMYNAGSTSQEQYVYDASGERVLRRSTSAGNTSMTVYAFGLEEHLYSGSGVHQSDTYYYSLGGMLIGESTGSTTNMFLTDALGSVIETISATAGTAAVQGNQVYSPYGSSRYQQGTMGTAKGFTGQYNDSVSGLDYYGSRYYDPVVGRFVSADALNGNLAGMDPYAYVGGNPETFTDPSGQRYAPPPGGGSSSPGQPEECFSAECHGGAGGPGDTGGNNGDQATSTTTDTTVNSNMTVSQQLDAMQNQADQQVLSEEEKQLEAQNPNFRPVDNPNIAGDETAMQSDINQLKAEEDKQATNDTEQGKTGDTSTSTDTQQTTASGNTTNANDAQTTTSAANSGGQVQKTEVIVDTNMVLQVRQAVNRGLVNPDNEELVITNTVLNETYQKVAEGRFQIPGYFNQFRVVPDAASSETMAQLLATGRITVTGREEDLQIGGTAIDTGRVLLTADKGLFQAIEQAFPDFPVRFFKP